MESTYNALFTYTSPRSDFQDTVLALQFGRSHVSYALKSRADGQLLALGYGNVKSWNKSAVDSWLMAIKPFLSSSQQVEIAYAFSDLSLLPVAGFEEKKLKGLHQSLYPFAGPSVFKTETLSSWQLYLGYPIPVELYRSLEAVFPSARTRHIFKLFLEAAGQSGAQGKLLVDIGIEQFSVLLLKNNRLQLFNTYHYSSPADVLYYLLSVCETQLVNPAEVAVVLTGLLEKESALYRELWQYFMHIEFREASFGVDDFPYPSHYFTTLNDILLCAS
jgi:hypothetical protein